MTKDSPRCARLDELSDAEVARIESIAFCAGGPPQELTGAVLSRVAAARPSKAKAAKVD